MTWVHVHIADGCSPRVILKQIQMSRCQAVQMSRCELSSCSNDESEDGGEERSEVWRGEKEEHPNKNACVRGPPEWSTGASLFFLSLFCRPNPQSFSSLSFLLLPTSTFVLCIVPGRITSFSVHIKSQPCQVAYSTNTWFSAIHLLRFPI